MIRQSDRNTIYLRDGAIAALSVHGMFCSEHRSGMDAFVKKLGFKADKAGTIARLAKPVKMDAIFLRRASTHHFGNGVNVLALGGFAGASRNKQTEAIRESPAVCSISRGTLGGAWTDRTPLSIQEPFFDLVAYSDWGLGVAYDDKDVLIGACSPKSRGVREWVKGIFEDGSCHLVRGDRFFAFCDAQAAADLVAEGRLGSVPSGYEVIDLTSRCEREQIAA